MQNSGLAATLAGTYFSPEAALPGAVFSTWHNLSGAVLAAVYRRRDGAPAPAAPASPVDAQEGGTPAPSSPAD